MGNIEVGNYRADVFYDKITKQYMLGVNVGFKLVYVPVCLESAIQNLKETLDDLHRTQSN